MIVLDTHIWVWWVHGDAALSASTRALLDSSEQTGLGVSAISCWEVAKLVERRRLSLPCPVFNWIRQALAYPGVRLLAPTAVFAPGLPNGALLPNLKPIHMHIP